MSIQNVSSSTAALNAQLAQQQQGASSLFNSQSLPQLSTDQVQSLQQALQSDLQQALSGTTGNTGGFQTQLDNSVSNSLSQAGFSQSQIQTVIDKLNGQGSNSNATSSQGHHGHHARRVLNGLVQSLESNATGQSSTSGSAGSSSSGSGATSTATSLGTTLLNDLDDVSSTAAGQSLDLLA
jgi:hypothetical protein